jgi:hypothetical protein
MCYCPLEGQTENNCELVWKAEIIASHFPKLFHSPTPPLKQVKSKTILRSKYTHHTRRVVVCKGRDVT